MVELNKIYNDNCFNLFPMMGDKSVDYVFTSPPYNRKRNDKYAFYDDAITDYFGFIDSLIKESLRVAKKHVIVNIQPTYYNNTEVYSIIGRYSKSIQQIVVWEKTNPRPTNGFGLTNSYEFFIILGDTPIKSNHTYTKNIIKSPVNSDMPKGHKAVMNQEVSDWFIETFTQKGDSILDPFMGTGTTAISCVKYDRNYIGFELSKEYCDFANSRLGTTESIVPESLW